MKFMIGGSKINVDYKDLLDFLVCDVENKACMFDECISCPRRDLLKQILQNEIEDFPDQITFKQWISPDKPNLITEVIHFLEPLGKLMVLKKPPPYLKSSI